ncbi:MAG: DUF2520 domain-containing protein [Elusimicrobiota bacterium]|jgi:predicted short-subunit dehydrogenase-like oxidoreductase (DUF2520 family)
MGRVPERKAAPTYLLAGSGRLAKHLKRYLSRSGYELRLWSRNGDPAFNSISAKRVPDPFERLALAAQDASCVLLALSDAAIPEIAGHKALSRKLRVHFSGAHSWPRLHGAHPLMSFGPELYPLKTYASIPFVCEKGRASFHRLFPGLRNPSFTIEPEQKPLYHALCSMSGNFTALLWQAAFEHLDGKLGLPRAALEPYLRQVCANIARDPASALTGPLSRGDGGTLSAHLAALKGSPLKNVYASFLALHGAKKQ